MALGTPVAAAVAYSANNGTSVSPAYPTGIQSTDVVLLITGQKPSTANGGTVTTPSGWTLREEILAQGGYGTTLGAGTGNTNLRIYSWDTPVAGQTGNLAVTIGANNISWAFMIRIPKGAGTASFGSADGARATAPTANTPFTVNLTNGASATNFQSGDLAIWAMCIPDPATTPAQFSAHSATATGATFATAVEFNEPDTTTGNDIAGFSAYASVSSGSSTAAPSITVTAAGTVTNVRGPVAMVRVRELPATQTLTPNLYTNTQTFQNPTITTSNALTPALFTNDQTFYSPTVAQGGATQNLTPSLYTNDQTFYGPTVTQSAAGQTLQPGLYTNAQTFYAPTVAPGAIALQPSLYSNTQSFYAPAVTASATLAPNLYTNAQAFYAATVSQGGTTQDLTFQDYVDVGYVEPDYVTWVASFQDGNQFFAPILEQFAKRGEGWVLQQKRKRKFSDERDEREQLRKAIKAAIDPVTEKEAKVVNVKGEVAVVTESQTIPLPVPPQFDAQAVAKMAVSVLEAQGIEAQRVRDAENRRRVRIAMEAIKRENERRLRKRRRDEEILLLM